MSAKKKPSFEEALKQLEGLVSQLESPDLALDKAMKAYQDGQALVEFCQTQLLEAEKQLKNLEK